jgi:hypothetical protein
VPTFQENMDQTQLEQLRHQLKAEQDLSVKLDDDLAKLRSRENAARGILREVAELANGHPEDVGVGDQQKANAVLLKIADEQAVLESKIGIVKRRTEAVRAKIASYDQPKLQRLGKIRELFQQLTRS